MLIQSRSSLIGSACRRLFRLTTSAAIQQRANTPFKLQKLKHKRKVYNAHNTSKTELENVEPSNEETEYLFGLHPILSALEAKQRTIEALYIRHSTYKMLNDTTISYSEHPVVHAEILNNIWRRVQELDIQVLPVNKTKLDKLTSFGVHQGLALTVSSIELKQLTPACIDSQTETGCLWILVNKIFDPMNLGGLLRTAAYFGVGRILISANCSKLSPVVSKASSGAMEFMSMNCVNDVEKIVSDLVRCQWDVVGTTCSTVDSIPLSKISRKKNTLVIVGNEAYGVTEDLLKLCTTRVTIPSNDSCPPSVDSLNVSVATGIILNQYCSSQ